MDDKLMNENLAAAVGMTVEELGLEVAEEQQEVPEEVVDEIEAEQAETDEPEVEEEHAETDEPVEAEVDDMPYAESIAVKAALAGDGLPKEFIEAMTPAQMRVYMAEREKRDAAFDRLRDKANKPSEEKTDEEGAPKEPDNPPTQVDLTALSAEFGENEATAIASFMSKQMEPLRAVNEQLMGFIDSLIDREQQSRLSGAVPEGHSEGWFEKVRARASHFGSKGMHEDKPGTERADALFDLAFREEFPDLPSPAEIAKDTKRASLRRNGTPSKSQRSTRKVEQMTEDDKMTARALAATEGKTVAEINRLVP